jgi:hypothetical protein
MRLSVTWHDCWRFFNRLSLKLNQTPVIWRDNVGIVTKELDKLSMKYKHIEIHQSWIHEEVEEHRLRVQWRSTNQMPADGMTKMLPLQKQFDFIQQLQIIDIRSKVQETEKYFILSSWIDYRLRGCVTSRVPLSSWCSSLHSMSTFHTRIHQKYVL